MMEKQHLKKIEYNIYRCSGFGVCKGGYKTDISPCPMHMSSAGFEAETPRGLMTLAREILEGRMDYSKELADMVFRCTNCGNCRVLCGATDPITGGVLVDPSSVARAMKSDLVENGIMPPQVRDFLKGVYRHGNPYLAPPESRSKWAEGLDVKPYSGQEYLFFVGCVGSYDERGKKMARALADLLKQAGVSFGILGPKEINDGNEIQSMGEMGLFQHLAEKNISEFKRCGVKKIICLSPHSYNALKNEYPALGGEFEVFHYSQILQMLIGKGKLYAGTMPKTVVTYHDSCFLGRHNKEYDAPRNVIQAVRGIKYEEMKRFGDNALCCGGGGGNFFTDILGNSQTTPARVRVLEAVKTGAQRLVVACPYCAKMFEDAIAAEQIEALRVVDLSELLIESQNEGRKI